MSSSMYEGDSMDTSLHLAQLMDSIQEATNDSGSGGGVEGGSATVDSKFMEDLINLVSASDDVTAKVRKMDNNVVAVDKCPEFYKMMDTSAYQELVTMGTIQPGFGPKQFTADGSKVCVPEGLETPPQMDRVLSDMVMKYILTTLDKKGELHLNMTCATHKDSDSCSGKKGCQWRFNACLPTKKTQEQAAANAKLLAKVKADSLKHDLKQRLNEAGTSMKDVAAYRKSQKIAAAALTAFEAKKASTKPVPKPASTLDAIEDTLLGQSQALENLKQARFKVQDSSDSKDQKKSQLAALNTKLMKTLTFKKKLKQLYNAKLAEKYIGFEKRDEPNVEEAVELRKRGASTTEVMQARGYFKRIPASPKSALGVDVEPVPDAVAERDAKFQELNRLIEASERLKAQVDNPDKTTMLQLLQKEIKKLKQQLNVQDDTSEPLEDMPLTDALLDVHI